MHKNVDKYDMDFISRTFGESAVQQMKSFFTESVEKQIKKMSKGMKLFLTLLGVSVVLLLFMTYIIVFIYH